MIGIIISILVLCFVIGVINTLIAVTIGWSIIGIAKTMHMNRRREVGTIVCFLGSFMTVAILINADTPYVAGASTIGIFIALIGAGLWLYPLTAEEEKMYAIAQLKKKRDAKKRK